MPRTWSHMGVRGWWANLQCWRNTFCPCFQLTLLPLVEFDGSVGAWYLWDATFSALKGQEPSNCYSQAEWLPHRKSRGNSTGLLGDKMGKLGILCLKNHGEYCKYTLIADFCLPSAVASFTSNSLWPPQAAACQAPLSMGFSRQEYWSGLLLQGILLQGIFPTQGLNPHLLHWQVDSLPLVPPRKPPMR